MMDPEDFRFSYWVAQQGGLDATFDTASLEERAEEGKHEPEDAADYAQQEQLRAGLLQLLTTLTPDERRAKLCALDSETLDCLAEAIEENQADAIQATKNPNKVLAVG